MTLLSGSTSPGGAETLKKKMWVLLLWAVSTLLCLLALSQPAHAARTINSVLLSYGAQTNQTTVTVPPGATISATVNVTHTGSATARRWRSTSWRIGGGAFTCADHANFDAAGTDNITFTITAPGTAGTYNAEFIAYQADGCATNPSATFTLAKGVIVVAVVDNSTVSADPTTVAADGVSISTITVTIRDAAGNPVAGKTVTLAALSGSSIISAASGPSNASGVVLFSVRDTSVEAVTYRATNTTDKVALTQTATVAFIAPALVVSFNVVEPGADPIAGKIYTKVAGINFPLDIVALRGGAIDPKFTGTVAVEVVDYTSGGGCSSLPPIASFSNQTFTTGNKGRHPLTNNTVLNAYRNAKVRVKYPAALPTITACSGDNFAIRPESLSFSVTDANPTTAGTARTLTNTALNPTALAGGTVHNAGRPFTITATAYNGAAKPAVATNYAGTPTAVVTVCKGSACTGTVGTSNVGSWSAASGTVTTTTATYDDVGAFTLQLVDSTFAAVDAADGTSLAQLTVSSTPAGVGRFVPDHFVVSAPSITPRSDIAACATSAFTYMGERMDASFTLTAGKFPPGSGTATRYTGALARLVLTDTGSFSFGTIDTVAPTPLTPRVLTTLGSTGTWVNGVATAIAARVAVDRNAVPDGPYSTVRLGIAPVDPDGVALDPAQLDLDADNSGSSERAGIGTTALRFGRLRLQNAHGSQLVSMLIPMEVQYWNATAFVTNAADSCTSFTAANVVLGNYQKNLNSGETTVTLGVGALRLSAPGAANNGSVDVSINLTASAAGASCTTTPPMPASTGSGRSYLQGAWCGAAYDRDPTARATFGVYRNSDQMIYQRENF